MVYPALQSYTQHQLAVSDLHTLHIEEYGNPKGLPVVHLHGGPGGGTDPYDARRFDPASYRIVLIDQRGSGKSTPLSCLEDNTTWALVEDIVKVRKHLNISKWVVFGGSWGSTLALAYAQTHPDDVLALVLRGIFTLRKAELDFFYQGPGSSFFFPEEFAKYQSVIPEAERGDMVSAYYKRLTSDDAAVRKQAGKAWSRWEMTTSHLYVSPEELAKGEEDDFADAFARIEAHFFAHRGFFPEDGWLLKKQQIDKIRHIPATIVQGRYDLVCPAKTAFDLHEAWPEADFEVIADAGHSAKEPGIEKALLKATDKYRELKSKA